MESAQEDRIPIIGYGSLMDAADLRRTCPSGVRIEVVTVEEWKRGLSLPAYNSARQCQVALAYPSPDHSFNAWLATIPQAELEALDLRERQYQRERVPVRTLSGDTKYAWIYRCEEKQGVPDFQSEEQLVYLRLCMGGCVGAPDNFWETFLETTWVGDHTLMQIAPHLADMNF